MWDITTLPLSIPRAVSFFFSNFFFCFDRIAENWDGAGGRGPSAKNFFFSFLNQANYTQKTKKQNLGGRRGCCTPNASVTQNLAACGSSAVGST